MLSMFSNRLLVVESDGFALRAAVASARRGKVVLEQVAVSQHPDPNRSLSEAIHALSANRLPSRAVLIMPEVASAVVQLPVHPKHPRPAAQMQELIRWEIEPQIALNAGARPIGEVLVGRGALRYEQVELVLAEMEQCRQMAPMIPGVQRLERFGEVAVRLGLVRPDQVDEALAIQQRFQIPADDLICGWTPLGDEPSDDGQYRWLVCGVSRELRTQCQRALAAHNIQLEMLYPHSGAAAPLIDPKWAPGNALAFEIQPGVIHLSRLRDGKLESLQSHLTAGHRPTASLCRELLGTTRVDSVWSAGSYEDWPKLAEELSTLLRSEVRPLISGGSVTTLQGTVPPAIQSTLGGVARHALRLAPPQTAVGVSAVDRKQPAWENPRLRGVAAAAVVVAGAVVADSMVQSRLKTIRAEHAQTTRLLNEARAEADDIKYVTEQVKNLTDELRRTEHELKAAQRVNELLGEALPRRMEFLPALLDALAKVTTELVAIERVTERNDGHIEVTAWALNQQEATRFGQAIADVLDDWNITVTQGSLWQEQGRLGLPGYLVNLEIGASSRPAQEPTTELTGTVQETH